MINEYKAPIGIEEEGELSVSTSAIDSSTPRIGQKDVKDYKRRAKTSFAKFYKRGKKSNPLSGPATV